MAKETKSYYAAVDIGSNAMRLLIKEAIQNKKGILLQKNLLVRLPLRLGTDAFTKGKLSSETTRKLCCAMTAYSQILSMYPNVVYRVCATSAMREISNREKVLAQVKKASGITIEVIEGSEEARLLSEVRNAMAAQSANAATLFVDVGGGSTELNLFIGEQLVETTSFNIGTVRMLQQKVTDAEMNHFSEVLARMDALYKDIRVVGTGGNINKLVRINPYKLNSDDNRFIATEHLRRIYKELQPLSTAERMELYKLKPDRADVIVPAAEIFMRVLTALNAKGIDVPTSGLSDGIIQDLFKGQSR